MSQLAVNLKLGGVAGLSKSDVNAVLKASWYQTGRAWRERYLPLHFGANAGRRYGYGRRSGERFNSTPRPGSYAARKLQFVKHQRPLEFSGEGKREALSRENISATRDKVVVRLPRKFNLRPKSSNIRMADEIRAVRPDEARSLTFYLADRVRRGLREAGAKKATVRTL